MRVLIGCEFSGRVREAFKKKGHDAWSCDYLETEINGQHYMRNILTNNIVKQDWDLGIFHPDCTFLTVAGARWMKICWRKAAQLIQPYMFGHKEFKATCFWLKNLEPLVPTSDLTPPEDPEERKKWIEKCANDVRLL